MEVVRVWSLREQVTEYLLRDSKNPAAPPFRYTLKEMAAFVDGAKKGEFDYLLNAVDEELLASGFPSSLCNELSACHRARHSGPIDS